jgi:hypothetical protein
MNGKEAIVGVVIHIGRHGWCVSYSELHLLLID